MGGSTSNRQVSSDHIRADSRGEANWYAESGIGNLNRQSRAVIVDARELPAPKNRIRPPEVPMPAFAERRLINPGQLELMRNTEFRNRPVEFPIEIVLHGNRIRSRTVSLVVTKRFGERV